MDSKSYPKWNLTSPFPAESFPSKEHEGVGKGRIKGVDQGDWSSPLKFNF